MTALDTTYFEYALKRVYEPGAVQYMAYKDNPFLALVPKNTKMTGDATAVPVQYTHNAGRSATFSDAQANKSPAKGVQFLVTRVSDYSLASITNETILASEGNIGAFMQASKHTIEDAIYVGTRSLCHALWRNTGGAIGQISATSNVATDTITLTNASDCHNFYPGQELETSTADGTSGAVKAGTVTVESVDIDQGTVTATGNWTAGIATAAASDYIFVEGDFGAKIAGVSAWITASAAGATSFFGVDRSVHTRLSGIRPVVSASTIREKLIEATTKAHAHGARTTHIFMNPVDVGKLLLELEGSAQFAQIATNSTAAISFEVIKLRTGMGTLPIMADIDVPEGHAFGLNMKTWKLGSLGGAPRILEQGGGKFLRESSADAHEMRIGYYGNLYCLNPAQNWRCAI